MKNHWVDVWVGLFVVFGFLAFAFLAFQAGNLGGSRLSGAYQLQAAFENTGGLKLRAAVRSAGVVVGRVADIHFDSKTYQALVTLDMDKRYVFPKDTSAKILTAGLLGEQYIGLEAGADASVLANGDRLEMTQSAVILENLISQFLYGKALGE